MHARNVTFVLPATPLGTALPTTGDRSKASMGLANQRGGQLAAGQAAQDVFGAPTVTEPVVDQIEAGLRERTQEEDT